VIKGRVPAEQGAMIVKALQMAMDRAEAEDPDVTAETRIEFPGSARSGNRQSS
jgi:hypothetical protein